MSRVPRRLSGSTRAGRRSVGAVVGGLVVAGGVVLPAGPAAADTTFEVRSAVLMPTGYSETELSVGDIDGDGDLDYVLPGGYGSNGLPATTWDVALNDGRGRFTYAYSDPAPQRALWLGDLDGDRAADMVYLAANGLTIRLADGTGRFGTPTTFTGADTEDVELADIDADADLDVVSADYGDRKDATFTVWRNNGQGELAPPTSAASCTRCGLTFFALGDLDNDGLPDIVASKLIGKGIFTVKNLGGGAFGPIELGYLVGRPSRLQLLDFDGDGNLDVLARTDRQTDFWLLGGDGTGGFRGVRKIDFDVRLYGLNDFEAADFDGDGLGDLAGLAFGAQPGDPYRLAVRYGTTRGLGPEVISSAFPNPRSLVSGDIDGDGDLDLSSYAYGEANGNRVFSFRNLLR